MKKSFGERLEDELSRREQQGDDLSQVPASEIIEAVAQRFAPLPPDLQQFVSHALQHYTQMKARQFRLILRQHKPSGQAGMDTIIGD